MLHQIKEKQHIEEMATILPTNPFFLIRWQVNVAETPGKSCGFSTIIFTYIWCNAFFVRKTKQTVHFFTITQKSQYYGEYKKKL